MRDPLALERRLVREAPRFDFFQALRLIECAHAERPRVGKSLRPSDDPVRLGQQPELAFATTEIAACEAATEDGPARLVVNFGLLGTDGPMPLHLTEYVRERERQAGDRTLGRFLDLFHHRMLSLLYRAWAAGQPVLSADRRDDDSFARYVASLCGCACPVPRGRDAIGDHAKLRFGGLLADKSRHASGLGLLLSQCCGVPVTIEQFVGQWLQLPQAQRTRLCKHGAAPLGEGRALGRKVWDRQHKFRVVIGPLDADECRRLQPGTRGFRRLADWVRLYAGSALDWDVELRLKPGAALPMRLSRGTRLARDTWLGQPAWNGRQPSLRFAADAGVQQQH